MPVKGAQFRSVRRSVFDHDNISPSRTRVSGEDDHAISGGKDGFTAVRIAPAVFIPIFTQMTVLAEVLRVVPGVPPIVALGHILFLADRGRKTLCWKREQKLRDVLVG